MALGDSYATLAEIRSRLNITDTTDDARLSQALLTASRGIEQTTRRQFNDAGTVSARLFRPQAAYGASVDDFHTTAGLIIQTDGGSGTFGTTWATTDYELHPLNGVIDGQTGWPYHDIWPIGNYAFSCGQRATLRVTARWGWSAVPEVIKEATLIVAAEIFKLKDAPFGVAGFGEYGAVRVRQNPMARAMIGPYIRDLILVG